MTTGYIDGSDDRPLRHQVVQAFGRRAVSDEFQPQAEGRARFAAHLPARVRRSVGRLITRM